MQDLTDQEKLHRIAFETCIGKWERYWIVQTDPKVFQIFYWNHCALGTLIIPYLPKALSCPTLKSILRRCTWVPQSKLASSIDWPWASCPLAIKILQCAPSLAAGGYVRLCQMRVFFAWNQPSILESNALCWHYQQCPSCSTITD